VQADTAVILQNTINNTLSVSAPTSRHTGTYFHYTINSQWIKSSLIHISLIEYSDDQIYPVTSKMSLTPSNWSIDSPAAKWGKDTA